LPPQIEIYTLSLHDALPIYVTEMEDVNGHQSFKVLTRFKDIKSISNITPIGEVIQVRQPVTGIQLKAATQEVATKGFPSAAKSIDRKSTRLNSSHVKISYAV